MIKTKCSKNAGFTLIEIIAVLLILAVLAAVAIPRYLNLIDEATNKALDGALAAGYSQLSMTYAERLLATGAVPEVGVVRGAVVAPSGDFTYEFGGTTNITVTVNRTGQLTPTKTGIWNMP